MRRSIFLLFLICLFFLTTRLYFLNEIPPSVYWDEASIGYNAKAVVETGRDEWGEFLPLHFRAFGEFKLPVYIYSVAAIVKLFGLSEIAIKLPAVFYSLGAVIFTFLIARRISGKDSVGLFSAFGFSIMPWFFIFSRAGYEVTAGLFFFLSGLYFFLLSKNNIKYFWLVAASFILAIYSYNAFRVLVPLVLAGGTFWLVLAHRKGKMIITTILLSLAVLLVSTIPIARLMVLDTGVSRFSAIGLESVRSFPENYIRHFSPDFLFISGDGNLRSHTGYGGQLFWVFLPLVLLGAYEIYRKKKLDYWMILLLLLIAPLPAAITKEAPHALRAATMAPMFAMIAALGLEHAASLVKKYRNAVYILTMIIFLSFFEFFYTDFYSDYSIKSSEHWQYGYKKLFSDYKDKFEDYEKVVISEEYAQPYIFALYYLKVDPAKFRTEVEYNSPDRWGFSTVAKFSNFEFKKIEEGDISPGTLVFATPAEKIDVEPVDEIRFLDGQTAFYVYDLNE